MPCTWGNQGYGQRHAVSPLPCHVLLYHHKQVHPCGCSPHAPHTRTQPAPTFCCLIDILRDRILASCWQETQHTALISISESLKPKPCSEERAAPRNSNTGMRAVPSQPRALTLKAPLLHFHMYNTSRPLIQTRYSCKQHYSSKATAIIFAMATEKERRPCPRAMFCCSKNYEKSPRGGKVWLSWPRYRYSLWVWHTNNAMLVEKGRCRELYLNFTMFA